MNIEALNTPGGIPLWLLVAGAIALVWAWKKGLFTQVDNKPGPSATFRPAVSEASNNDKLLLQLLMKQVLEQDKPAAEKQAKEILGESKPPAYQVQDGKVTVQIPVQLVPTVLPSEPQK